MQLILFDCDGTLSDSFGLICETMRRTFVAHDLVPPADVATRAIIGLSLATAIERLRPELPQALVTVLVETYRTTFRSTREDPTFREALFPGAAQMLGDLRARDDVLLGLVNGKTRRGVDAVCATHGLEKTFAAIRTADDCPSKPHPAMVLECCDVLGVAPDSAIVVGDAVFDMQMASAAGAASIGVTWGAGGSDVLKAAGAGSVVDRMADLAAEIDVWLASRREHE